MKKFIVSTVILLALGVCAFAQPRSAGLRFGFTSTEFQYQHFFGYTSFLEVDLGVDRVGDDGFKASATYNWEFAHPSWSFGAWTWYMGPGATIGYVCAKTKMDPTPGFMIGGSLQLGCECEFDFPIAISADVRPQFGYQFREGTFYDAGLLGLIPTLSVKYKF